MNTKREREKPNTDRQTETDSPTETEREGRYRRCSETDPHTETGRLKRTRGERGLHRDREALAGDRLGGTKRKGITEHEARERPYIGRLRYRQTYRDRERRAQQKAWRDGPTYRD